MLTWHANCPDLKRNSHRPCTEYSRDWSGIARTCPGYADSGGELVVFVEKYGYLRGKAGRDGFQVRGGGGSLPHAPPSGRRTNPVPIRHGLLDIGTAYYKDGFTDGQKQGREEGKAERARVIAVKLLRNGMSVAEVASITELPVEVVSSLASL